jgi:c-di-GMP-binding flagellar brake protein YcgR
LEGKTTEKRRFPRITLRVPVAYRIRGTVQHLATLSRNIGEGGMGVLTNQFLAPNTLLNLEFTVLQKFFSVYARTKWIASVPSSDNYHFGLEFLEIPPKDKEYIFDYVKMQGDNL